jgi:serine/threonine protein phosphatase PrpC
MRFSIFQESRKGTRASNQDRAGYCYTRESLLMVVADGMGGHLHGEVASHIALHFLTESFQREAKPKLADPAAFLRKAMTDAHLALGEYATSRNLVESPRTTCVACVVQDSNAYWAHVGDSRLYHIRGARVEARTRDHSRVQLLVDHGRIREEAVAAHPDRNKIFNCIGASTLPQVDLSGPVALRERDTLVLCSDGFWGALSASLITAALGKNEILKAMPELLNVAELRAGADCDNLSVVAMTWAEKRPGGAAGAVAGEVSTLELDGASTRLENFGDADHGDLSDEEIEQAIREIRAAIRKHTPQKP